MIFKEKQDGKRLCKLRGPLGWMGQYSIFNINLKQRLIIAFKNTNLIWFLKNYNY